MESVFEILLDVSGSMGRNQVNNNGTISNNLLPDGSTRISLAKSILSNEVIPTLDYASQIFIRTFSAPKDEIPFINPIYEGQTEISEILKKIDLIANDTPFGGTPITAALKVSLENFRKKIYDDYEKVIILISDGEENGGGTSIFGLLFVILYFYIFINQQLGTGRAMNSLPAAIPNRYALHYCLCKYQEAENRKIANRIC